MTLGSPTYRCAAPSAAAAAASFLGLLVLLLQCGCLGARMEAALPRCRALAATCAHATLAAVTSPACEPTFCHPPLPACLPQELGLRNAWVTEAIFWCMFIPFILWSFSPFVTARKRFYTAVLYARLLMVLVSELAWRAAG